MAVNKFVLWGISGADIDAYLCLVLWFSLFVTTSGTLFQELFDDHVDQNIIPSLSSTFFSNAVHLEGK